MGEATAVVRCCRQDGSGCESDAWGLSCQGHTDYWSAKAYCEDHGLRLCHYDELEKCCGSGCGFDGHRVWTQTQCESEPTTTTTTSTTTTAPPSTTTDAPIESSTVIA